MSKLEIINEIAMEISTVYSINMNEVKNILVSKLHNFELKECTSEVATLDSNTTESLFRSFAIAKLCSNKSESTLELYKMTVYQLCDLVKKELSEITSDDVQYYLIVYKKQHNISDTTMESRRLYLSSVFSWLYNHKKISNNPMAMIEPIKCRKKVKTPLSEEEIEKIRINLEGNKRDLAIVEFFLSTGVRVSELCGINIGDVDFEHNRCKILGKGNKERMVYFSGKTKVRLQEYLLARSDVNFRKGINDDKPLFVSQNKTAKRLEKPGVEYMIKQLGKVVGVTRLHCHLFRATFATNLAKNGVDVNIIAKALGHTNLATVQIYCLLSDEQVEKKIRSVNIA